MNQIIEITSDNCELSVFRGFLRIKQKGEILKDLPFDLIASILCTGHGVIYTQNFLQYLCDINIPMIICGKNYIPSGILISLVGQQKQMEIQQLQIGISKPLQKNLWQSIIKEKIKNQSKVLDLYNKENKISHLVNEVLSGDITNVESNAARIYFPSLFGKFFIRNTNSFGINSYLNYGYAIFRACIARLVIGAGLNPSIGLKHHNKLNPFCLVDDLIEPFRPIIDNQVYNLFDGKENKEQELIPEHKKLLSGLLEKDISTDEGFSPLRMIMQQMIWDLVNSIKEKSDIMRFNKNLIKKL